jgi:hypothetical protein
MTTPTLTPADLGSIAATLDDCRAEGLGDDETVARLERTAEREGFAAEACYGWFRAQVGK